MDLMEQDDADGLRAVLKESMSRRNVTVNAWTTAAGISESVLRNFLAGRSSTLTHATLVSLARAAGTTILELLRPLYLSAGEVFVLHEAKADYWSNHYFADHEARFKIHLPQDFRYPNIERIGVLVSDDSCNLRYRSGTILVCAQFEAIKRLPEPGDMVLSVESKYDTDTARFENPPDLERTTIREFVRDETGVEWLTFRSTEPKWQKAIPLLTDGTDYGGGPSWSLADGGYVVLEGLVIGSYRLE